MPGIAIKEINTAKVRDPIMLQFRYSARGLVRQELSRIFVTAGVVKYTAPRNQCHLS